MLLKKLHQINPILFKPLYFNHYQTLNLTPAASYEQIKVSFLSLAKKYHPDLSRDQAVDRQEFLKIKQAYDILKQPNSKKLYDMEMFPQKIEQQAQKFYFYRTAEFENNHQRRKNQQKRKVNIIINSIIFIGVAGYIAKNVDFKEYLGSISMHQLRRQNFIMSNEKIDDGPAAQERRRQQYAQQMKDKKIYGSVIQLKVRGATKQTTRAKQKRLQGITSIEGVQKQRVLGLDSSDKSEQYM